MIETFVHGAIIAGAIAFAVRHPIATAAMAAPAMLLLAGALYLGMNKANRTAEANALERQHREIAAMTAQAIEAARPGIGDQ